MDDPNEVWLPCHNWPGIYASSNGRIVLPDGEAKMPNGNTRKYTCRPTRGSVTRAKAGAKSTHLSISNRKLGNLKVHQLVCDAFHGPRPSENSIVIHIDENGLNNRPYNLKWGTQKENLNMPKFIEYCRSRTGNNSPLIKWRKSMGL